MESANYQAAALVICCNKKWLFSLIRSERFERIVQDARSVVVPKYNRFAIFPLREIIFACFQMHTNPTRLNASQLKAVIDLDFHFFLSFLSTLLFFPFFWKCYKIDIKFHITFQI